MLRLKKPCGRRVGRIEAVKGVFCVIVFFVHNEKERRGITFLWSHLAALAGMHAIMEPRCDVPAHLTQKHHTSGFCERGSHNGCQVKKHNEKLLMAKEGGEQGGGWRVGTYW